MLINTHGTNFSVAVRIRNICFVLVGAAGLLLKRHYPGPYQEVIQSYIGNVGVSFAVYFVLIHLPLQSRYRKLLTAGLALAVVELFEALDGFGVMANVYDPADFLANAVGIALAWAVDSVVVLKAEGSTNAESNKSGQ